MNKRETASSGASCSFRRNAWGKQLADTDRLVLLDRLADRVPELDLAQHSIDWMTLDDGAEALLVNGGGIDGGDGAYLANAGDDVHGSGRWRRSSRATSAAS